LDPDSNPDPESDPELIPDPDPNLQVISDLSGSGCTTLACISTYCSKHGQCCTVPVLSVYLK
jgi:hypothetical protein